MIRFAHRHSFDARAAEIKSNQIRSKTASHQRTNEKEWSKMHEKYVCVRVCVCVVLEHACESQKRLYVRSAPWAHTHTHASTAFFQTRNRFGFF